MWFKELIVDEMELSPNALDILRNRYLEDGESPNGMFTRVSGFVARCEGDADTWAKKFYTVMVQKKFIPNSPTLVNASNGKKGCLSACFVVSPSEDTMESILNSQRDWGIIEKWGGGVGMGLSKLRPKGDSISTTKGKALGPISVMEMFAHTSGRVTQGAFRLGAHMAQLSISHPDIRDFIHCKDDDSLLLSNFNISVQIPDEFMRAVDNGSDWSLINPRNMECVGAVSAKGLWGELCESAWKTGDPGVIFMDRIKESHPNPNLGEILSTNPCGEQALEEYSSCNLGHINLSQFVTKDGAIDWADLEDTVRISVRFLDDVVEVNSFPLNKLKEMNLLTRRIGLGVMGWADMLLIMGIRYDSTEALKLAEDVSSFLSRVAWDESFNLGKEKGPFPNWEQSKLGRPYRNSDVTTIAPTGSTARIFDCSSGIEPYFNLAWYSNILWKDQAGDNKRFLDAPVPVRTALLEKLGLKETEKLLKKVAENPHKGRKLLEDAGVGLVVDSANDISVESHIKMQAAWQKNITNSISKTINLPNSAVVEDVQKAFRLAWELGCKSVTVYRDGSKKKQVLEVGELPKSKDKRPRVRPKRVNGFTERIKTGHGTLYTTINLDSDSKPFEVFSNLGKAGGCDPGYLEAVSRLISLALRSGVDLQEVITQLRGVTCHPIWDDGNQVTSPVDAIATVLSQLEGKAEREKGGGNLVCLECGASVEFQEGCVLCKRCGWSMC